jgi:hypothetical protein
MFGTYFYHEILRKTIIAFGTLFNNIEIKHKDTSGNGFSQLKVPIAYGPMQKFLARIEQSPNLRKEVAITLPRMAFEMVGISYDPTRKSSTMQTFKVVDQNNNKITKAFMPVPYNVNIRLSIMTKLNEDALQIVEQILPYFQPHFNLTVNLVEQIGETRDIPMVLNSIQMDDDYEGDFTTRRSLVYTLDFTAKTYLFGPVDTGNDSIIKKVQVDYYTNTERKNASRELRYVATPKALKDYNSDGATQLSEDIAANVTEFSVEFGTQLISKTYIQIGEEVMFIREIAGNVIKVNRGENGTIATTHEALDYVNAINAADDELIDLDDDFGFNESTFNFNDGKIYSTTKQTDVDA